jgi:hypothetical protein
MRWVVIDCAGTSKTLNGTFAADYQIPSDEIPVLVLRVGKNNEGLWCDYQLVLKATNATGSEYERVGLNQSSDRLTSVWGKVDWTRAKERTITIV